MTTAMLVPIDGTPHPIEVDGLADLQTAVGGSIEAVDWVFDDDRMVIYVNEEGKCLPELGPNRAIFADHLGMSWDGSEIQPGDLIDVLFGDFVVCGFDPETGADADLTDEQVEAVNLKFGAKTVGSGPMAVLAMQLGIQPNAVPR